MYLSPELDVLRGIITNDEDGRMNDEG